MTTPSWGSKLTTVYNTNNQHLVYSIVDSSIPIYINITIECFHKLASINQIKAFCIQNPDKQFYMYTSFTSNKKTICCFPFFLCYLLAFVLYIYERLCKVIPFPIYNSWIAAIHQNAHRKNRINQLLEILKQILFIDKICYKCNFAILYKVQTDLRLLMHHH